MKNRKVHSLAAIVAASATIFTFTSCGDKSAQQMQGAGAPEIAVLTVEAGSTDLNSSC